jgi:SAM-dependent methyltransferase
MPRRHSIFRVIPKLIFLVNRFFFRRFYSNFEFHPETRALETNPLLGAGNGHALSRDLHVLIPFLVSLRFLGCKSILDLGSGDGFVLKLAEKFRYSEIIGIEAHSALFELLEKNCTRAKLHNLFFEEINADDFPDIIDLIYLFNPTDYVTVIESCMKLKCKWLLMKNFSLRDQDELRLKVVKILNYQSYSLYRSKVYNRI